MPVQTYEDYKDAVKRKISWDSNLPELTAADIEDSLSDAVDLYSRDRPLHKVYSITGDGGYRYDLPSDWEDTFSSILYVEYPAGDNATQEPTLLDFEEVTVWEDDTGKQLHFRFRKLTSSDEAWVKYTARHTLDASTNTIPDSDFNAVVILATAYTAMTLAGHMIKKRGFGGTNSGSLGSFRTVADEYKSYGQEMFKKYCRIVGIPESGAARQAAIEIFDLDSSPTGFAGSGWLTHLGR